MKFIIKTPEDFLNLLNKSSGKNKNIKKTDHVHVDDADTENSDTDKSGTYDSNIDDPNLYDFNPYGPDIFDSDIYNSYIDSIGPDNDMNIIDVSDFTPPIIKKVNNSNIPGNGDAQNNSNMPDNKSFNQNYWYHKLNLYSIGYRYMPVQVEIETKKLFEQICNYLDDELKNKKSLKKTSLMKLIRKLGVHQSSQDYILNILYHISENIVRSYYTKENNGNRNNYQHNRLQSYLGNSLMAKVYAMADQLGEELPPADEDTRRYYNITKSGLRILWWDRSGEIREEATFDHTLKQVINTVPHRQTKIWDVMGVRKLMVTLYLDIWSIMTNYLNTEVKWNNKVKNALSDMVADKNFKYIDYDYGGLFTSLIKLSENTVRGMLPSTTSLNIDEDIENIKYYLPKPVADNIFTLCGQYKDSISKDELHRVVDEMACNAPEDWKLKAWQILNKTDDEQINLIISYANDVNFTKMIKEVINKADDEDLLLFCLYGLSMNEKLTAKNTKLLNSIIHLSNVSRFNKFQDEMHDLTIPLYKELTELKNPIRKKIELNLERIKESKDILNNTVDKISEYIGEDITKDIVKATDLTQEKSNIQASNKENNKINNTEINKITNKTNSAIGNAIENETANTLSTETNNNTQDISLKHVDFIKSLLDHEKLEISIVKDIATKNGALLNSFISDVNKELYEYLQDQAIIMDENDVMIDEFYIEMIKELLNGAKTSG